MHLIKYNLWVAILGEFFYRAKNTTPARESRSCIAAD